MEEMVEDQLAMLVKLVNDIKETPMNIGILADTLIDKIRKLRQNYALYQQGKQLRDHLVYQLEDGQPSIQSKRRIRARKKESSYTEKVKEEIEKGYE
ncbi:MAG: hypothetical protein GWO20_16015 [Candidatus Korarchaeota archaeon]|nr:hypothetical protein [Candidatus Korarchaeota archaeon]NIU84897.1 hypothetical protein [Candidatus Thorarchaeota archaeon]NIW14923.1 hypothetical protein [Candidatus Thorarchaeota archaeon]NIW52957.1 hypothetical protein [Candidatus Korarchaeota archaeon]